MEATTMLQFTEEELALGSMAVGGFIGAFIGFFIAVALIFWVFQIIAFWKIFVKANEPGWKSIIPFYNSYTVYKISWRPMWFWLSLLAAVLYGFMNNLSVTFASPVFSIIALVLWIVILVLQIAANVKLSRAFGHGAGFAVGLTFLWPIFILILGYGKSEYKGADL